MQGLRIGSAFGIPVRLHWSFLLVLPLFAGLIGSDIATIAELLNRIPAVDIDAASLAGTYRPWILGFVAALGLFVGVLLHEFGHSVVALRYGYDIDSISLWLLGGLANFTEMPEDWRHEFQIAVAGPLVSIGVGLSCAAGFLLTPEGSDAIQFVLGYLAVLNVGLAVFNMLPAFPMDGGRVLRALLARNQPHAEATQQAADVGKLFAFLMGLVGLLAFNVILILLAFFIYIAASSESQQTAMKAAFEGVTVGDIMTTKEDLHTVSPDTSVADLIDRMLVERHTGYPVVDQGAVVGMVTLDDTQAVKTVERDAYLVSEVMSADVQTIGAQTEAIDALQTLRENNIGRLPVVDDNGELVGLISRTDLMTAFDVLQTRNRQ
jgi:Zn-dependent protease/CBS domain-containing protein